MCGRLPCRKKREGPYEAMTLSEKQSIYCVLERTAVGFCRVFMPNGWEQLHLSFKKKKNSKVGKLCDVLAQGIIASGKGSIERRVLRGCLSTAAPVDDCQLLLADACDKKNARIIGSDLEENNDEQVTTSAVNDNI